MFSWAFRRRFLYLTIIFFVIGIPTAYIVWRNLQKPPSCMDNVKNQNEHGTDCGGICQIACMYEVQAEPTIEWSRAYYVSKGIYNLVAYLQNPNTEYISQPVKYTFSVYDQDNVLLATREGIVALPTTKLFPIFEPTVVVGSKIPKRVSFEFNNQITWIEYHGEKPELEVVKQGLILATTTPTLNATIRNKTLNTYKNVEVVAIVYDEKGNGFATSRTYIDTLGDRGSINIHFTWPEAFTSSSSKIEIIPKLAISLYK